MTQIRKLAAIAWYPKVLQYLVSIAVFLVPLYVGRMHWFPFTSPKAIVLQGIALLILIVSGIALWKQKEWNVQITILHGILAIFLLLITVSSFTGVDIHNSFFGTWSQPYGLVLVFSVGIIACAIGFLVRRDENFLSKLLSVSFVASILVAILTYGGDAWISSSGSGSTLGNSSYAGAYLLMNICFGIGLIAWYKKRWQRWGIGIGTLVILFSPIFFNQKIFSGTVSLSRAFTKPTLFLGEAQGAIVGLAMAIIVITGILLYRSQISWKKYIGLGILVLTLIGSVALWIRFINPESSIHHVYASEKSGNRFAFWDIAKQGFRERPIFGHGFNNYNYVFQKYFKSEFYTDGYTVERWTNQPHNIMWEYLSNTGIIGTIGFLSLLVVTGLMFFRKREDSNQDNVFHIVLLGSLMGYFVQNLFVFDTPVTYLMLFMVIGSALGMKQRNWEIRITKRWVLKTMGITLGVGGIVGMVFLVILPWKESLLWREMTRSSNGTIIQAKGDMRKRLQSISPMGGVQDSAYLSDSLFDFYQKNLNTIPGLTPDILVQESISVEEFLDEGLEKQPNNFRAHLVYGNVVGFHGIIAGGIDDELWNKSYERMFHAMTLNPQSPDPYFVLAGMYVANGNTSEARNAVRQGIDLAPEYSKGYVLAESILKLQPNQSFASYIRDMKERYRNP